MNNVKQLCIIDALHSYKIDVDIAFDGDTASAEFGGELPADLVQALKADGAEVLRYGGMGMFSTVVNF